MLIYTIISMDMHYPKITKFKKAYNNPQPVYRALDSLLTNNYTSNVCVGFLPGHASFAYFFFFGSRESVTCVCGAATGAGVGTPMSTSGAGLGRLTPNLKYTKLIKQKLI